MSDFPFDIPTAQAPQNMMTTDTFQTVQGSKTYSGSYSFNTRRPTSTLSATGLSVAGLNDFVTRRDGESLFSGYEGFQAMLTSTAGSAIDPWKTWIVQFGDSNMWNSTTGKITIPSDGNYLFYVNLQGSAPDNSGYFNIIFNKTSGTAISCRFLERFPQLTGTYLGLQASEVMTCDAGDEFTLKNASVNVASFQAYANLTQVSQTSKMGCFKIGS